MTGWRCGWAIASGGVHRRLQHGAGPFDVERLVDRAEGGGGGADRPAGRRGRDARRVPPAPRSDAGVARPPIRGSSACGPAARSTCSPTSPSCWVRPASPPRPRSPSAAAEARVALTAGEGFDAPGFVRLSYATSLDRLREGVTRIQEFVHARERRRRPRRPPDVTAPLASRLAAIAGEALRARRRRGPAGGAHDALRRGHLPDVVVTPGTVAEVAAIARAVPRHPHAAGGARRRHRLHRRLGADPRRASCCRWRASTASSAIDDDNLLAVVQPNVVTGDLHAGGRGARACSIRPTRPACANARSAATSPSAPAARAPSSTARRGATCWRSRRCCRPARSCAPARRSVKNVAGYSLTDLLVGSEGTLAILTEVTLRLVPRPPQRRTLVGHLRAASTTRPSGRRDRRGRRGAGGAGAHRRAVARGRRRPPGPADGATRHRGAARRRARRPRSRRSRRKRGWPPRPAGRPARPTSSRPPSAAERDALWEARRELSYALRRVAPRKINHDLVVPRGRVPALFALVDDVRRRHRLRIACFGHAGDGNIHVNLLVDPADADEMARAGDGRAGAVRRRRRRSAARSPASTASASPRRPTSACSSARWRWR